MLYLKFPKGGTCSKLLTKSFTVFKNKKVGTASSCALRQKAKQFLDKFLNLTFSGQKEYISLSFYVCTIAFGIVTVQKPQNGLNSIL